MDENVFRAILAMDAYNRTYNEGIKVLSDAIGTEIGDASIILRTNRAGPEADASFYAIAYDWDGKTVISYRGTDQPFTGVTTGDIPQGYWTGGGDVLDTQARMAIGFYQDVMDQLEGEATITGEPVSDVLITGHSMGGGHAGLVAALFREEAVLFDQMPFQLAAERTYAAAAATSPYPVLPWGPSQSEIAQLVYGDEQPWAPAFDQISSFYIPSYELGSQFNWLARLRAMGGSHTTNETKLIVPDDVGLAWTQANRFGQGHDATLIVLRLFLSPGEEMEGNWQYAAKYFLPQLFDQELAKDIPGADKLPGNGARGDVANAVRTAIAYSAIDEGARVFGDTGIFALRDDANDLGAALKEADVSKALKDSAEAISQSFVQFAGLLAVRKDQEGGNRKGVLTRADDGSTLTVSFTDQKWDVAGQGQPPRIVGEEELRERFLSRATGSAWLGDEEVRAGLRELWADKGETGDGEAIDRFASPRAPPGT